MWANLNILFTLKMHSILICAIKWFWKLAHVCGCFSSKIGKNGTRWKLKRWTLKLRVMLNVLVCVWKKHDVLASFIWAIRWSEDSESKSARARLCTNVNNRIQAKNRHRVAWCRDSRLCILYVRMVVVICSHMQKVIRTQLHAPTTNKMKTKKLWKERERETSVQQ